MQAGHTAFVPKRTRSSFTATTKGLRLLLVEQMEDDDGTVLDWHPTWVLILSFSEAISKMVMQPIAIAPAVMGNGVYCIRIRAET
ncbi:unnamed protein product [Protopolystoma xenopodis]|uniref:Uncharacterized protein n=1 Tax=Protopolystoma xenopodis TaxID=117903 RepID=A0A448X516_9PLAT|nr:unnamed protein product [Protopolystoma xenopodis]